MTRKQEIIEERQFLGLILDHMHVEGGLLNNIPEFDKHAASLERLRKQNTEQFRVAAGMAAQYNPTAENSYDLTGLCDHVLAEAEEDHS